MKSNESKNTLTIVLIVLLSVAIVAAVVCIIGFTTGWFGSGSAAEPTDAPTESTGAADPTTETEPSAVGGDEEENPEETTFQPVANGDPDSPAAKAVYSSLNPQPGDAEMTAAVATFEGGQLTNAELNIYFWMEYYNFMSSYGDYVSLFGLDTNKPLYQQASMSPVDENDANSSAMSWEQSFLQSAVENYRYFKGMELAADAAGFVLPEEYAADLETMITNLDAAAEEAGYEDSEAYLQMSFGTGTTIEDYRAYYTTYITSYAYYCEVLAPQCQVSDEEATAYFSEHEEDYAGQSLQMTDKNDISVRHILITPEKDLDSDGDGTMDASSDEAKAAAKAEAERIYALWQEDPTEENFGALAKEYTADSNGEQGGLYNGVYPGQMVPSFNDWCFDELRQPGDHGIVETDYGYHIMYFVGVDDSKTWLETARQDLTSQKMEELSMAEAAKFPVQVDYLKIVLCDVVSQNVSDGN